MLERNVNNPILKPEPLHDWENFAVFNGSIAKIKETYYLMYRAIGNEVIIDSKKLRLSVIGKASSADGAHFANRMPFIIPEFDWEKFGCEDPRITEIDGTYLIFYTAIQNYPPNYLDIHCAVAVSKDLKTITEKHLVTPFNAKAMTMFSEKINGLYTVFLTVNTDKPPATIAMAQFQKLETIWDSTFWEEWYEHLSDHTISLTRINSDQVEIGAPPVKTKDGWLLIHSYIKNYFSSNKKEFSIEGVLLDLQNPQKVIGRIEQPLLVPTTQYEKEGFVQDIVFPEGAFIEHNELKVYYGAADNYCALATIDLPTLMSAMEINSPVAIRCQKFINNPLLQPDSNHDWESKAVFNPAAVALDGKVFLIYRALSDHDISGLGLAVSNDGMYIDERLPEPIYPFRSEYEKPRKPGMAAGCEDPRITIIDDTMYMCYTAFDGELPRLAFSSITINQFLDRNWTAWAEPKIISPPHIADKDGALFPEKIQGKYGFFHRIEPNIVIDLVDSLEFSQTTNLGYQGVISPRAYSWDGVKVGINAPPIKTRAGWLVIYHGISQYDQFYRVGALLLDLIDITKVIGRTPFPILEPEAVFEKQGIVNNVVFPCGAVIQDEQLILYYGGADTVVCAASINLESLLSSILNSNTKKYLKQVLL